MLSVHDPAFDAYAEEYDSALAKGLSASGESKEYFAHGRIVALRRQLDVLQESPGSVMDFGCGIGSAIPYLRDVLLARSVLGVDLSEKSLVVAQARCGSERTVFRSLREFQPQGNLDLAFCNGVFHHIPLDQRDGAAKLVFDSLRGGGLFSLWENNPFNPATRYVMSRIPFDRDASLLTPSMTRALLKSAGFEILRTDFHFIFPRLLRALRPMEPSLSRWPLGTQYQVLARKPHVSHLSPVAPIGRRKS